MAAKSKTKTKSNNKPSKRIITKSTHRTSPKIKARNTIVSKRVTFTPAEFKEVQKMLTANDCQTLKEWIVKRIGEQIT